MKEKASPTLTQLRWVEPLSPPGSMHRALQLDRSNQVSQNGITEPGSVGECLQGNFQTIGGDWPWRMA